MRVGDCPGRVCHVQSSQHFCPPSRNIECLVFDHRDAPKERVGLYEAHGRVQNMTGVKSADMSHVVPVLYKYSAIEDFDNLWR